MIEKQEINKTKKVCTHWLQNYSPSGSSVSQTQSKSNH